MPLERIRRELRRIRAHLPGERFERTHERHRINNHAVRVTVIAVGCGVMVIAAVTFWVPGPNFVIVLAGLALVAGQWRFVARMLDRGEVAARRWHEQTWEPMPRWRRRSILAVVWLAGACLALAMAYVSWRQGLLPFLP
ncbi:MAG: hypothetical protein KDC46_12355 [Thermoleophilia bacterium]|nr:hypothetical protein [Thermoleophilia bacterium]